MKYKNKIAIATTAVAITSIMLIAYLTEPAISPVSPQTAPVSALVNSSRDNAPPVHDKAVVSNEYPETSTRSVDFPKPTATELIVTETTQPQPTEKEKTNTTPIPTTQMAPKPTAPTKTEETTPKNGDTRIVNGKQQSYLLGFGWVDYMGENEVIYCEGMYENGNKVGVMD